MTFNINDEIQRGYENAEYFLTHGFEPESGIKRAKKQFAELVEEYGPVIDGYPAWHPLVSAADPSHDSTEPDKNCGYKGLDHTVLFANGFVTCPYRASGKGQKVIDSVEALSYHSIATITAKRLDQPLYNGDTETVLVTCEWEPELLTGNMIPTSIAMGLLLEREISNWNVEGCGEPWQPMHSYFLGQPCDDHSSLFVSKETGQAMKRIWNELLKSGMYGPIKTY